MSHHKKIPRCYDSHPPLKIGNYRIYGGSCAYPVVHDADIYVGFDLSMAKNEMSYPWVAGESFLFYIPDMGVPADRIGFKSLVEWIAKELENNLKVHIGCIGGHGRTGMVLAALVKHMTGNEDAITYVRKHYCQKAVESNAQVEFLYKEFGIKKTHGAKEFSSGHEAHNPYAYPTKRTPANGKPNDPAPIRDIAKVRPTQSPACIWGANVVFDKS